MKKPFFLISTLAFLLAACASKNTELPLEEPNGADAMKTSPCACAQLEYSTDFVKERT